MKITLFLVLAITVAASPLSSSKSREEIDLNYEYQDIPKFSLGSQLKTSDNDKPASIGPQFSFSDMPDSSYSRPTMMSTERRSKLDKRDDVDLNEFNYREPSQNSFIVDPRQETHFPTETDYIDRERYVHASPVIQPQKKRPIMNFLGSLCNSFKAMLFKTNRLWNLRNILNMIQEQSNIPYLNQDHVGVIKTLESIFRMMSSSMKELKFGNSMIDYISRIESLHGQITKSSKRIEKAVLKSYKTRIEYDPSTEFLQLNLFWNEWNDIFSPLLHRQPRNMQYVSTTEFDRLNKLALAKFSNNLELKQRTEKKSLELLVKFVLFLTKANEGLAMSLKKLRTEYGFIINNSLIDLSPKMDLADDNLRFKLNDYVIYFEYYEIKEEVIDDLTKAQKNYESLVVEWVNIIKHQIS